MKRSTPLQRRTALRAVPTATPKPRGISPATDEQRAKARFCIVTGARRDEGFVIDPAHLTARARGGCDSPLCVVGLRRDIHRLFDNSHFDLLPYLVMHRLVDEIAHALEHYDGDLIGLANRLTGDRYVPARTVTL